MLIRANPATISQRERLTTQSSDTRLGIHNANATAISVISVTAANCMCSTISVAKLRKVESKTKEVILFFAETE